MQNNTKNKKVLVFIDQMAIGGAARVTSILLDAISEEYHVTLAYDNIKYPPFYNINKHVKQISYHIERKGESILHGIQKQIKLSSLARKIIKEDSPDIIIAVTHFIYSQVLIGSIGYNIPIIAYDHTSFSRDLGYIQNFIRTKLYRFSSKVIVLTNKDKFLMRKRLKNSVVIYNPLTYEPIDFSCNRENWILCVGRLNSWFVKGFDRIISIWGSLSRIHNNWKLIIAGGGSDQSFDQISKMIKSAGVENSVVMLGQVENMMELYRKCAIFVLPSRVEGFPMSLLESLSQGCPFVSYSLDNAVKEMTTDGESGYIVEDNQECDFKTKLEQLIINPTLRSKMSERAPISVARFNIESYSKQIRGIINELINS